MTPAELTETEPRIEASAPAEALFLEVQIDDRGLPYTRKTTKYVRYKIYDPEKAESVTRLTDVEFEGLGDRVEIHGRLLTPDGRVEEFGREAIKERPLVKTAQQAGFLGWLAGSQTSAREKFLAIPGVVRGAVVEFYTHTVDRSPRLIEVVTGQMEDVPVRSFEYRARLFDADWLFNRTFYSNSRTAKLTEDKKTKTITVTAQNLPAYEKEPFSGPITDQILTVFNCYETSTSYLDPRSGKVPIPDDVKAKSGPWAYYATVTEWEARDKGYPTKRLKALAAEIVQAAQTDTEKAKAIHRWVRQHFQGFRVQFPTGVRNRTPSVNDQTRMTEPRSVDDIIDWQKDKYIEIEALDFLWLAFGLCREAKLPVQVVMLPDRELAGFNESAVSRLFLPDRALALKVGDKWEFFAPHVRHALPYNMLPWENEGQVALLALPHKQEFIPVPVSDAQRSLIGTGGGLLLDERGTLGGSFMRRLTGQAAVAVRGAIRDAMVDARNDRARKLLNLNFEGAEIKVTNIAGLDDPDAPLDIACSLRWEGFAVKTKDRLIFRPLAFRSEGTTPFPAEKRRRPVYFPRLWQELDQVVITWPEGYGLEGASPLSPVTNAVLHYKVELSAEADKRRLHARRTFESSLVALPVDKYEPLRSFYDHVTRGDQLEAVLVKQAKKEAAP
ncbi:MAG TPA: DUF3857 domain-containing protein [Opitutaceae bacterium]